MPLLRIHRGLLASTIAILAGCASDLALVPFDVTIAAAQDADLRGVDDSGGFPTSPPTSLPGSPTLSPEDTSPPTLAPPSTDLRPASTVERLPTRNAPNNGVDDPATPNYGKARKKKPKLFKPDPKTSMPLAPLVPYRGAPGPQRRLLNPLPADRTLPDAEQPGPTVAVIPSPLRPRVRPAELDPFVPIGVRVGEVRLLPFLETSTGFETNPNQVTAGIKPSAVLRVESGLDLASDFPTNSLSATIRAGYSEFPSNSTADRPDVNAVVKGRIDVDRQDTIDLEGRLTVATQTPGSPLLAVPNSVFITSRPTIISEGATAGVTHTFNRLSVNLRATVDRTQYGDASQSDGSIFRYSQDDYNDFGGVARVSYELTPALIPFVEAGVDTRLRDTPIDLSGFLRDSVGFTARAGSAVEFGRLLTGTVSAGYADRHYADPRLPNLRGPTVDGSLIYAATPLTTVTLRASTALSETTLAGASGALSRLVSLEVAHVFFRNFTVSGIVTYQPNEYQGVAVTENFLQFTLKGAYNISRDIQLIGSASHQQLGSTLAGSSFEDNIFLLGVRLQR